MRSPLCAAAWLAVLAGCGPGAGPALPREGSSAQLRAARRAYDGAPPVVPHQRSFQSCGSCHDRGGVAVPDLGVAPASPHAATRGIGAGARCDQCHVERTTAAEFRAGHFEGLPQRMRHRAAATPGSPPVMPHPLFMREDCEACHVAPGSRSEIRTTHPERKRCRQCHVEASRVKAFEAQG